MAPVSKFSELSPAWQACFVEGWQAFLGGNVPIGSAITDPQGQVLYQSRNRISDASAPPRQVCNSQVAHAELNTILMIEGRPENIHDLHIYTLVEPCPLCMGAIYMAGLRHIHYAFPDTYAGSTNLLGASPYLGRKAVRTYPPNQDTLHEIVAALQIEFNLRRGGRFWDVMDAMDRSSRLGRRLAEKLISNESLQAFAAASLSAVEVFDQLAQQLAHLETA